jgi:FAD synthase
MNAEAFLKKLVTEVEPNATVVGVEQRVGAYHASVVGTTRRTCELAGDDVMAAEHAADARRRVTSVLKRCADDVVAPIGDGRS